MNTERDLKLKRLARRISKIADEVRKTSGISKAGSALPSAIGHLVKAEALLCEEACL